MKRFKPAFLLGILLFIACATPPALPPQPWTEVELSSGIRIQVRFSGRDDLIKRFGNPSVRMNPLLDYPAALSGKRILVVEVRIDSQEYKVELVTRKTTILFEDAKPGLLSSADARAMEVQELQDAWMPYLERTSRVQEMMRKTREALSGNLRAGPDGSASGYLVFLHAFPRFGIATLDIALRAADGDEGTVQVTLQLPRPDELEKTTGIFAQPPKNPSSNSDSL